MSDDSKVISLRLPLDLVKRLPTTDRRRSPSRSEFIVLAVREKLARDDPFKLPLVPAHDADDA